MSMNKTNVMDAIISHLQDRNILFVPRFAPYFIASFGCHVFNMKNKEKQIYSEHGRIPDLRMHCLFVAPPGFFKSMLMKVLTHPDYGALYVMGAGNKPIVPMTYESMITEGGWTGSFIKTKKGGIIPSKGLAEEYKDGIVCFEEFSAMTQTMKQQHSLTLDAALLTSLAGGEVRKRVVSGTISYETNITVFAGTQQGRFDLSSGLGRRLFFLNWVPSVQEGNDLKHAYWNGMNVELDKVELSDIRARVAQIVDRVDKIHTVEVDPTIKDMLMDVPHFEHSLFVRFAMGYQIMTGQFSGKLKVTMTDKLKHLFSTAKGWREHLLAEAEGDQIIQILIQSRGEATGTEICDRMLGFGSSIQKTRKILWRLTNRARVLFCDEKEDIYKLRKKKP